MKTRPAGRTFRRTLTRCFVRNLCLVALPALWIIGQAVGTAVLGSVNL